MNIEQFAKLKAGDQVYNGITQSIGTITSAEQDGVKLKWKGSTLEFSFSVNSTIWYHWELYNECATCGTVNGHSATCPEERQTVCDVCGSDDPPNHKPGCTSAHAQATAKP